MAKSKIKEVAKESMPGFVQPMLATLTDKAFDSPDWLYEIKWDGYRTIARVEGNTVNLLSRNNLSFDELFKPIKKALMFLGFDCMLDGEIVVLNDEGLPDFNMIQNYGKTKKGNLVYYIFDVLYFNGHSTQDLPLINRKEILAAIPLPKVDELQVVKATKGNGIDFFEAAKKMSLEGIIAKTANSVYTSGRAAAWLKIKNTNNCEAIIIGYTTSNRKLYFGSLLLGYFKDGRMVYVGHAGTGFTNAVEKELFEKFQSIKTNKPTAPDIPSRYAKDAVWLKPVLVCRVQFQEITSDGKMRHTSFKGLIKKEAKEITAIC